MEQSAQLDLETKCRPGVNLPDQGNPGRRACVPKGRHVNGRNWKARHVTARPEGPGYPHHDVHRGLKGRPQRIAHMPPLQGGGGFAWTCPRACSPGCHRAGFQPCFADVLKVLPISQRGNVNEIVGKFGGAENLRAVVTALQNLLYAA